MPGSSHREGLLSFSKDGSALAADPAHPAHEAVGKYVVTDTKTVKVDLSVGGGVTLTELCHLTDSDKLILTCKSPDGSVDFGSLKKIEEGTTGPATPHSPSVKPSSPELTRDWAGGIITECLAQQMGDSVPMNSDKLNADLAGLFSRDMVANAVTGYRLSAKGAEYFADPPKFAGSSVTVRLKSSPIYRVRITGIVDVPITGGKGIDFDYSVDDVPNEVAPYLLVSGSGAAMASHYDDGWRIGSVWIGSIDVPIPENAVVKDCSGLIAPR